MATAGKTDDGQLGTSAPRIAAAIRSTLKNSADKTLILLDLKSAALSLKLALKEFDADEQARLQMSEAPLVEGAVLAAVQASVGATLNEVAKTAANAASMQKMPTD